MEGANGEGRGTVEVGEGVPLAVFRSQSNGMDVGVSCSLVIPLELGQAV